jgi:hypothetical protein
MEFDVTRLHSALAQLPCPRIALELGCGADSAVASYFAIHCPTTRLIALDHNFAALRQFHRSTASLPVQADIKSLPFHIHFDLIIARHPDIDRHRSDWQQAFASLPQYLSPAAHLLITTYSVPEADLLRQWLTTPLPSGSPSPFAERGLGGEVSPPDLSGKDRFILCYQYGDH